MLSGKKHCIPANPPKAINLEETLSLQTLHLQGKYLNATTQCLHKLLLRKGAKYCFKRNRHDRHDTPAQLTTQDYNA